MLNFELIQSEYEYLKNHIYMDCSSLGMPPKRLKSISDKYFNAYMEDKGKNLNDFFHTTYESAKKELGLLLGVEKNALAFFKSTTDAIISVANSLNLQKGDNVIITDEEHPANVIPWLGLQRLGVEIKFVKATNRLVSSQDIIQAIDKNTKVVSVSSVFYCTGASIDLQQIGKECREKDILFVVDAIQSVGRIEIRPQELFIDFLACGGYKSLLGLKGIAVGYTSKKLLDRLVPYTGSNQSVSGCGRPTVYRNYNDLKFNTDASIFENGNYNYMGILSLKTTAELLNELQISEIEKHIITLDEEMRKCLKNQPLQLIENYEGSKSGIVVGFPNKTIDYAKFQKNINCSDLQVAVRDNGIRIGLSFYNTIEQVKEAANIIEQSLTDSKL